MDFENTPWKGAVQQVVIFSSDRKTGIHPNFAASDEFDHGTPERERGHKEVRRENGNTRANPAGKPC
jgi:hypothetical protein